MKIIRKCYSKKRKREFYFNPRLQGRFHCIRNFTKFTEIKKNVETFTVSYYNICFTCLSLSCDYISFMAVTYPNI